MMGRVVRLGLAVVAGLLIGSVVNMSLIMISASVIPPPAGVDVTTTEGLKASIHLFEPRHFVFPFLAHGLGTLVGAWVAAMLTLAELPVRPTWLGLRSCSAESQVCSCCLPRSGSARWISSLLICRQHG